MMHRASTDDALRALPVLGQDRAESTSIIPSVLDSPPMRALRFVLDRKSLQVEPHPIVYKDLSDSLVRLMFPVTGGTIVDGAVVSVVCLFDRLMDRTLYAHPMHAGPGINPLVRHLDGPMAAPKSQSGADGGRASRRIIEHKLSLWDRFVQEQPRLGGEEAGRRWREGYYWALQRLYFCAGCTQCKWGSPFFDGPDPTLPRKAVVATLGDSVGSFDGKHAATVAEIVSSDEWSVEANYARRGGFTVLDHPRLIKELDDEFVQVIFPTNLSVVQAGALVAVAFTYHVPSRRVAVSHCLCAGPESEIQFLKGDVAFGLPKPQAGTAGEDARSTYRLWRREAWSRFWLNELESGLDVAGETWIDELWIALGKLFGGNDVSRETACRPSRTSHDSPRATVEDRGAPVLPHQAIENMGGRCFTGHATNRRPTELRALGLSTLMVNVGHRCNQACHHCHVDAGPDRTEEMSRETVDLVLHALGRLGIGTLDITGGAPELNPHFRYLAAEAVRLGCRVVDRCNLTIISEPGYEDLPEFLAEHGIEVTASLPSDEADVADRQRGDGSFAKSISALQRLNALGYGMSGTGLMLNLVHNPSGIDLGAVQGTLERHYKRQLFDRFGIEFDRLFTMNNMPVNRFERFLKREGRWSPYMDRLTRAFNPDTVDGLMCRRTISVGYDGRLYDCDFNQVMNIPLSHGLPDHIRDLDASVLQDRKINTAGHCFGCTAGAGSSCNGALVAISSRTRAGANGHGQAVAAQTTEVDA
jgi:radical SAM/Cys-rich protein